MFSTKLFSIVSKLLSLRNTLHGSTYGRFVLSFVRLCTCQIIFKLLLQNNTTPIGFVGKQYLHFDQFLRNIANWIGDFPYFRCLKSQLEQLLRIHVFAHVQIDDKSRYTNVAIKIEHTFSFFLFFLMVARKANNNNNHEFVYFLSRFISIVDLAIFIHMHTKAPFGLFPFQ